MILLQPQKKNAQEYEQLARKFGLKFELMDLAFCSALDKTNLQEEIGDTYDASFLHSCHGVFADLNFSGSDPLIYEASKQRFLSCAGQAAKLGIKKMVVHSCFHPVLCPDDPLYEMWSETFAQLLCEVAEQYQMELFVENVLDRDPDMICRIMNKAGHESVKVCLDIGHANLNSCPLEQWFSKLQNHLAYVHLSDNCGQYDEHLAVGKGTVDWSKVKKLVEKYNIKADYTLEVAGITGVVESINYLRTLWEDLF